MEFVQTKLFLREKKILLIIRLVSYPEKNKKKQNKTGSIVTLKTKNRRRLYHAEKNVK